VSTPPEKPDSAPSGADEYWDYAEDETEAERGRASEQDTAESASVSDFEDEEVLEADEEVEATEESAPMQEEPEAEAELDEDEELEAETELDDDEELEADEDEDDTDLGEGIELESDEPKSKSRAPIIWALAAAAWVGVFAVKYGGDESVDEAEAGPSLAVVEKDEAPEAPSPAPADAAELDAEDHGSPSEAAEAPTENEEPSKIKLPEGLHGRWYDENWAAGLATPKRVGYTVKRGGSIKFIANLYTIYHHEIEAMNPGVPLEKELGPGTKVTIYERPEGVVSESVGLATRGTLVGAVPMLDGPGRMLKHTPAKGWATAATVAIMDRALTAWSERSPDVQPVLVGNMSARNGGRLKPHGSHQSGRDVDLSYIQKGPDAADLNWREMSATNLDAGETWKLLETLVATRAVEHIFIDTKLQKVLYDYAVANKLLSRRDLSKWLEYPRPVGSANAIVKHVKGHTDHIHVRFGCPAEQKRCRSK
jgi:murein endopeptidase